MESTSRYGRHGLEQSSADEVNVGRLSVQELELAQCSIWAACTKGCLNENNIVAFMCIVLHTSRRRQTNHKVLPSISICARQLIGLRLRLGFGHGLLGFEVTIVKNWSYDEHRMEGLLSCKSQ